MHLFSTSRPQVRFTKLNQVDSESYDKCLELVTQWFTKEWGYIHDKNKEPEQAIEDRKNYLSENSEKVHLVFYEDRLVGAFRYENKEFAEELIDSQKRKGWQEKLKTNEIWFIYVDPDVRGLGVGHEIVKQIKQLSKDEKAEMVLLETLKPSLNHLYQKEDAKIISENTLDNNPSDVLRIKL